MKSKYAYYAMLGCIVALILALLGGAYGANKLLASASVQLRQNRLRVQVLAEEQSQLASARQDVSNYQSLAAIAQSIVPQDKDQAQTVRQIVDIAHSNNIALSSITFPASTLGTVGAGATSQGLSQLTPVVGIPGVYDLLLTVQSDSNNPVAYSQFINFLSALEHNRRTALVSGITLQPNEKNRNTLSFTLVLGEYVKP